MAKIPNYIRLIEFLLNTPGEIPVRDIKISGLGYDTVKSLGIMYPKIFNIYRSIQRYTYKYQNKSVLCIQLDKRFITVLKIFVESVVNDKDISIEIIEYILYSRLVLISKILDRY